MAGQGVSQSGRCRDAQLEYRRVEKVAHRHELAMLFSSVQGPGCFTVQVADMVKAALRERENSSTSGNLGHGRRHVAVHLNSRRVLGQTQKVLTGLLGKVAVATAATATFKQVGGTLEAWMLLIEFGTEEEELVGSALAELHDQRHFLDIVVPTERVPHVQASPGLEVLQANRFYHHLLPGTLLRVARASQTEHKENIDPGRAAAQLSATAAGFLVLCHQFALFKDCFAAIEHMRPPDSSSVVPYDVEFWHRRQDPLPLAAVSTEIKPAVLHKKLVLPSQAVTFMIGKRGKSIEQIRQQTSAVIKIHETGPTSTDMALEQTQLFGSSHSLQLVSIHGSQSDVDHTQLLIEEKLRLWKKQQLLLYQ